MRGLASLSIIVVQVIRLSKQCSELMLTYNRHILLLRSLYLPTGKLVHGFFFGFPVNNLSLVANSLSGERGDNYVLHHLCCDHLYDIKALRKSGPV